MPAGGEWVGPFLVARCRRQRLQGNRPEPSSSDWTTRAPEIAFQPIDASDPTRIDVRATDAVSPIATTELEVQRRGSGSWTPLQTVRTADGFTARLDDEQLPDGLYELRARATDGAGNERSTDSEPSGGRRVRSVPTRIDTRLVAGHVKVVGARRSPGRKRRRVIIVRPTVPYGTTLPIDGRLTMPGGNPVPGGVIEVWEQLAAPGRRIASHRRDRDRRTRALQVQGTARSEPSASLPLPRDGACPRADYGGRAPCESGNDAQSQSADRRERRRRRAVRPPDEHAVAGERQAAPAPGVLARWLDHVRDAQSRRRKPVDGVIAIDSHPPAARCATDSGRECPAEATYPYSDRRVAIGVREGPWPVRDPIVDRNRT